MCKASVGGTGVKHGVSGLWSHRNVFSGVMNRISLPDNLMDGSRFGGFQENAIYRTMTIDTFGGGGMIVWGWFLWFALLSSSED